MCGSLGQGILKVLGCALVFRQLTSSIPAGMLWHRLIVGEETTGKGHALFFREHDCVVYGSLSIGGERPRVVGNVIQDTDVSLPFHSLLALHHKMTRPPRKASLTFRAVPDNLVKAVEFLQQIQQALFLLRSAVLLRQKSSVSFDLVCRPVHARKLDRLLENCKTCK